MLWTQWYTNFHHNEGLRQCERDLCRGGVILLAVLVWWSWGFGIVRLSGGIKPESLRSNEQFKYCYIYENTKLELQKTWKSLHHKLSSGNAI